MTKSALTRAALGLALSLPLLLAGCASLNTVTSEVSSYGSWPAGRAPGHYAFERLPSQQQNPQLQSRVEAAAAPALQAAGFKAAAVDQADVMVQVAAQVRVVSWGPYDGFGPYRGRFGMGGWFGGGRWSGLGLGMSYEPPVAQTQVDVLMRDRRSNQVLYETHAVHQQNGGLDEQLLAPMFEAALKDFPSPAISPRQVSVPRSPQN